MYFLYDPTSKNGYMLKLGRIFTAKNKYIQQNYHNKNIHDTHVGSTDKDYYFPHEFVKQYSKDIIINIYKQMLELFHYIKLIIQAKCYQESKKCFQIFGADIMITKVYKIKLLEMNNRIGIATYDNKIITEYMTNGILETIVDPLLPPINKQPKKNYFIKV